MSIKSSPPCDDPLISKMCGCPAKNNELFNFFFYHRDFFSSHCTRPQQNSPSFIGLVFSFLLLPAFIQQAFSADAPYLHSGCV